MACHQKNDAQNTGILRLCNGYLVLFIFEALTAQNFAREVTLV